jgi:leucyl aminopeptidase (aminopeptidase T)
MQNMRSMSHLIVNHCAQIKSGQEILIITDDQAHTRRMGDSILEAVSETGARGVLAVIPSGQTGAAANEPPPTIGAAVLECDVMFYFGTGTQGGLGHTTSIRKALDKGVRRYMSVALSEDEYCRVIAPADVDRVKVLTEAITARIFATDTVRITTPGGTDVTFSIKGRKATAVHPLDPKFGHIPDYGEANAAPVEGTANGTVVIDGNMLEWNTLLTAPLVWTVKDGHVVHVEGAPAEAERMRELLRRDEGASNIAEFAIGTSHILPPFIRGNRRDAGYLGRVHLAIGRSDNLGGLTYSKVHIDGLMRHATVYFDGEVYIKDDQLVEEI